ncbi:MAG TPA: hypothetical protein VMS98_10410 [Thermoanaerobaculia bacterium]|nr:hypothetical protein [Thermoanaerobaculia bacterium]
MRVVILSLIVAMAYSTVAAPRGRLVRNRGWGAPACTQVTGLPNLLISTDRARTFFGNPIPPPTASSGAVLAVEDVRGLIVAAADRVIHESRDAGCTWTARYNVSGAFQQPLRGVAAPGGRAWFWTQELLLGYDDDAGVVERPTPEAFVGFGVDAGNADHIRGVGASGQGLWDSADGGLGWRRIGLPLGFPILTAAVNPANIDHIVAVTTTGLFTSRDGGTTWAIVPDFSDGTNVCQVVFSPSDPNVVWMLVRRGTDFIFRSTDGGSRFEPLRLPSGVGDFCFRLIPHPRDANVLAMAAGGIFFIDAAARTINGTPCCGGATDDATFSPADAFTVYVFASPP